MPQVPTSEILKKQLFNILESDLRVKYRHKMKDYDLLVYIRRDLPLGQRGHTCFHAWYMRWMTLKCTDSAEAVRIDPKFMM